MQYAGCILRSYAGVYDRMQPAYDRMHAAYERMQPAYCMHAAFYDRMQPACIRNVTAALKGFQFRENLKLSFDAFGLVL